MNAIRVYRNVNSKDKVLGLELADGCILLGVFFLVFMVNKEGLFLNALALILAYFGLRTLKRGKPDGYLPCLTRYVLSPEFKRLQSPSEHGGLEEYPRP